MSARGLAWRIALLWVSLGAGGCSFDHVWFFDVLRTPTDLCDITSEGEFCDPEVLPPVEQEGWTVQRQEGVVHVFIDEEVWLVEEDPDDETHLTAAKLEVATSDPGPCTTTHKRSMSLTVDVEKLEGSLGDSVRTVGGQDCGESPRGQKITWKLDGAQAGSP